MTTKTKDNIQILLMQFRRGAMKEQEYQCFLKQSGLRSDQLISFDVLGKQIGQEIILGYDALFIGGSGDFSVLDNSSFLPAARNFICYLAKKGIPIYGSCFGHQLIAQALGGEVICEKKYKEVGTYKIYLTDEAKQDVLFQFFPSEFWAQEGHKDAVVKLPAGAINLAYSAQCPYQAFTFSNRKIYGTQFHPELTKEAVLARIDFYGKDYVENSEEFRKIKGNIKDSSPETAVFLNNFIERVILGE